MSYGNFKEYTARLSNCMMVKVGVTLLALGTHKEVTLTMHFNSALTFTFEGYY